MKMIKNLAIFTCLATFNVVNANDLGNSKVIKLSSSASEVSRLKAQESILKNILKHTELIQLKDGTVIDLRDLEEGSQLLKGQNHNLNGLMEAFRAVEGGGTGAGG